MSESPLLPAVSLLKGTSTIVVRYLGNLPSLLVKHVPCSLKQAQYGAGAGADAGNSKRPALNHGFTEFQLKKKKKKKKKKKEEGVFDLYQESLVIPILWRSQG